MFVYKSTNVCLLKLLLLYLTSIHALPLPGLNITSSNGIEQASNTLVNGKQKLTPLTTNVTIIPGPNLDSAIPEVQTQKTVIDKPIFHKSEIINDGSSTVDIVSEGQISNVHLKINESNLHENSSIHSQNRNSSTTEITQTSNKSFINIEMEGGGKPKQIERPVQITDTHLNATALVTPQRTIPVSESSENARQKISARKGVNNSDYKEFKKLVDTAVKPVIKKPLFTEATEDEPSGDSSNFTTSLQNKQKVPSLDSYNKLSSDSQQYVVPIIIVILSVPLVTVVISYFLKRGAEWWKYRHYRRMDFLINGIYDT